MTSLWVASRRWGALHWMITDSVLEAQSMAHEILHNALFLAQGLICVWVVIWSIRRRGDFDERLSPRAQVLRWTVVVCGVLLASIPWTRIGLLRGVSLILAAAFL